MDEVPVHLDNKCSGYKARDVTKYVLWPAGFHGHDCN
jgi:hypothetical protein